MPVLDTFSLKGKKVLITGGTSGFGVPVSTAIAEAGATTIIASRNRDNPLPIVKELRAAGYDAHNYYLELGQEASIDELYAQVKKDFGTMDVLINNAVARPMREYADPLSTWRESMEINATGLLHITRLFGNDMAKQGHGSIINTSSIYGIVGPTAHLYGDGSGGHLGSVFAPDYCYNKAGMINLSRYFAAILGKDNVRVNSISPGGLGTEKTVEPFLSRYTQNTFLGRMATNEDIKGAFVFLASDASSYITGTNLVVDGGFTAH